MARTDWEKLEDWCHNKTEVFHNDKDCLTLTFGFNPDARKWMMVIQPKSTKIIFSKYFGTKREVFSYAKNYMENN